MQIQDLGTPGVVIPLVVLVATMLAGTWIGTRWSRLTCSQAVLAAAGSAVRGAAAMLAITPTVKTSPRETVVAIASVVLLGTAGIFLYPWLYTLVAHADMVVTPEYSGVYIGVMVHEIAQVITAACPLGDDAINAAIVSKMVRVLALAPLLVVLTRMTSAEASASASALFEGAFRKAAGRTWKAVPWFAADLLAVTLLNSAGAVSAARHIPTDAIDTAILAYMMLAIGTQAHVPMLLKSGMRPSPCAAVLWVGLVGDGVLINMGVRLLMG